MPLSWKKSPGSGGPPNLYVSMASACIFVRSVGRGRACIASTEEPRTFVLIVGAARDANMGRRRGIVPRAGVRPYVSMASRSGIVQSVWDLRRESAGRVCCVCTGRTSITANSAGGRGSVSMATSRRPVGSVWGPQYVGMGG